MTEAFPEKLVLYDGECGLCDRFVQSLIRRDKKSVFHFAPLQGATAQHVRQLHPKLPETLSTMGYLRSGTLLLRSRAAFAIWQDLGGGWKILAAFRILPTFLTDAVYRAVAAVRYKIWGRADACQLPDPDVAERFLD